MKKILLLIVSLVALSCSQQKEENKPSIIAYYMGGVDEIDNHDVSQLSHINYSFVRLDGNHLSFMNEENEATVKKLASLKENNPGLKVMLALGGWGGCEFCSQVFSTEAGRKEFSESTLEALKKFNLDGIDLDWEYPVVEGYPGHQYTPEDKENFTELVKTLMSTLGNNYEISFAAGGYAEYLEKAIYWGKVMPLVDRVNIMSYDLINGYSKATGHHCPLYSTPKQKTSADHAVKYLINKGVPSTKIVIGAASYTREWKEVPNENNGLYESGTFETSTPFKNLNTEKELWDSVAQAPYIYEEENNYFRTYDNRKSVQLKSQYVLDQDLGGIMFWGLTHDIGDNGLLETIHKTIFP